METNSNLRALENFKKMKQLLLFLSFLALSCSPDLEIPSDKVTNTLLEYGKENTENQIVIKTKFGNILIELYNDTPLHRANFIRLIKNKYYDDRKIYRIVKGLCIQGGANNEDKLKYLIPSEFRKNRIHKYGSVAMARYSEGNEKKMSSATEFFIITKGVYYGEEELTKYSQDLKDIYLKIGGEIVFDNEYTVFGEVLKGIDVAEKISQLELVDTDKPLEMPRFSIEIIEK